MIKYTIEEEEQLNAMDLAYYEKHRELREEREAFEVGSEEWLFLYEKHNKILNEYEKERDLIRELAEKRTIESYKGREKELVDDLQDSILYSVFTSWVITQEWPFETESEASSWKWREPESGAFFTDEDILNRIELSFRPYFDALEKTDTEEYQRLRLFIHDAIKNKEDIVKARIDQLNQQERSDQHKEKQTYRTRKTASAKGAITSLPRSLAIPTLNHYQYSMSLCQAGGAYLQPLSSTDGLKFRDGKMYFDGIHMQEVSEVELQNMKTKEGIANIDLPALRSFYSIILTEFEKKRGVLEDVLTISVPVLAEFIGLQSNLNKKDISRIIEKTQSYHNVIGVLHGTRNNKPTQSLYPVLNFEGYDDTTNTISFSSPYMNYVIKTVYDLSVRRTKKGEIQFNKNGEPRTRASHSYLIDSSITKEKNKAAVENVVTVITLIERAGENIPRMKASTIIERNPQLQERLATSSNPAQLLTRTFSKTWELLRDKTNLTKVYKDIELPDPENPASIPTPSTLEETVYSFPHKGKKSLK